MSHKGNLFVGGRKLSLDLWRTIMVEYSALFLALLLDWLPNFWVLSMSTRLPLSAHTSSPKCVEKTMMVTAAKKFLIKSVGVLWAWENSQHFATPYLLSPWNGFWPTTAEISYWWRVTTQMSVSSASNWLKCTTSQEHYQIWVLVRHEYGFSVVVSQMSFRGETRCGVAKCRLFP